jgi:hypothetical protein
MDLGESHPIHNPIQQQCPRTNLARIGSSARLFDFPTNFLPTYFESSYIPE